MDNIGQLVGNVKVRDSELGNGCRDYLGPNSQTDVSISIHKKILSLPFLSIVNS